MRLQKWQEHKAWVRFLCTNVSWTCAGVCIGCPACRSFRRPSGETGTCHIQAAQTSHVYVGISGLEDISLVNEASQWVSWNLTLPVPHGRRQNRTSNCGSPIPCYKSAPSCPGQLLVRNTLAYRYLYMDAFHMVFSCPRLLNFADTWVASLKIFLMQDEDSLEQYQIEMELNDQPDLVNSKQSGVFRPISQVCEVKSPWASAWPFQNPVAAYHVRVLRLHSTGLA